nr:hypothetical protein HmN_000406800 [Hymenolepis microstoma]
MGQSGEKIYRNVEMANFTSPTVLSRCCAVSFSPHSPRSPALELVWRSEKLDRLVDLIER